MSERWLTVPNQRIVTRVGRRVDGPATVLTFRAPPSELDALAHAGHPFFTPVWFADIVGHAPNEDPWPPPTGFAADPVHAPRGDRERAPLLEIAVTGGQHSDRDPPPTAMSRAAASTSLRYAARISRRSRAGSGVGLAEELVGLGVGAAVDEVGAARDGVRGAAAGSSSAAQPASSRSETTVDAARMPPT